MSYSRKKTENMYYHGKNTFVVPLFYKIVGRFYIAHIKSPYLDLRPVIHKVDLNIKIRVA